MKPPAEPVVRHHPALNDIIIVERPRGLARWRYDLALARRLRAQRFDLVIDFHGGPRSGFLTWATRAPQRIGYDLPGRRWCYTTRVPWTRSLVPPRHSVLNQWALLEPLGIEPPDRARDAVTMTIDAGAAQRVDARLAAAGVDRRRAADRAARQRRQSVSTLARRVVRGSRRGAGVSRSVDGASSSPRVHPKRPPPKPWPKRHGASRRRRRAGIVRTGEFDLSELRALVDRAALYIGGDSGPLHIAATTRTPIVALFGPTLPERSMPWRDPCDRRHRG